MTDAPTPTRADHLAWCQGRALDYLNRMDRPNAIQSMLADLGKHPETATHPGRGLGVQMLMAGLMRSDAFVRFWIEGFH